MARVVQVAGDVTIDWLLAASSGPVVELRYAWEQHGGVRLMSQAGGAALLVSLLDAHLASADVEVEGPVVPADWLRDPHAPDVAQTFSIWDRFPRQVGALDTAWRLRDFLGQEDADPAAPRRREPPGAAPDCLVIDDANLGLRDEPSAWPSALHGTDAAPAHIVLKMANPLARGPLWDLLVGAHADRLTVFCSLGDLRKEDALVGQPMSWEQLAGEVATAVRGRTDLSRAARVIVGLEADGAVLVERGGQATLVFDSSGQAGGWEASRPGSVLGTGTCVAAALAAECSGNRAPSWTSALRRGLRAARALHEVGLDFGEDERGFPISAVARALGDDDVSGFTETVIHDAPDWTILGTVLSEGLHDIAHRIVIEGPARACPAVPIERVGAWTSLDRGEIESMRSVRNIMTEYLRRSSRKRPLSIAVFGPPGSGKSFAIKQMVKQASTGLDTTVVEFNLAQFGATEDLANAFRRLRDCAVSGSLPIVFWDEFDAALGPRDFGWLVHFLAPMQDAEFFENGALHPIGPAVFVFAGATHSTMAQFRTHAGEVALKAAKAPDFVSRLRGFVDIRGPNPVATTGDDAYVLRRALLLHSLLRNLCPQVVTGEQVAIDEGVLRAFLGVREFRHGARSMESIIDMSALTGRARFERASLPLVPSSTSTSTPTSSSSWYGAEGISRLHGGRSQEKAPCPSAPVSSKASSRRFPATSPYRAWPESTRSA